MSQYTSSYPPSVPFDAAYKSFFESFYQISDTPPANEQYADQFTEDATLVMASKTVKGRDGTFVVSCHVILPSLTHLISSHHLPASLYVPYLTQLPVSSPSSLHLSPHSASVVYGKALSHPPTLTPPPSNPANAPGHVGKNLHALAPPSADLPLRPQQRRGHAVRDSRVRVQGRGQGGQGLGGSGTVGQGG